MKHLILPIAAAALVAAAAISAQPQRPVAEKAANGRTLVVPRDHREMGTVHHTITGRDRQIYFESDAPLEDIKGQSNAVIGYAVIDRSRPGGLVAGEWHLPVSSMRTGIKLRDEHLAGKDWLDAAANPDVIVQIREFKDVEAGRSTDAFTTHTGTFVIDLTLNGVTGRMDVGNSSITAMKESAATRKVAPGDLLAIRSKFLVTLADHEVSHPVIGEKVAKDVSIDVALYLSDEFPPAR